MKQYLATFFSHFGAVRFQKLCVSKGWQAQLRPVPRSLSSSCGTCVSFATNELGDISELKTSEMEQIVLVENGYNTIWSAED